MYLLLPDYAIKLSLCFGFFEVSYLVSHQVCCEVGARTDQSQSTGTATVGNSCFVEDCGIRPADIVAARFCIERRVRSIPS